MMPKHLEPRVMAALANGPRTTAWLAVWLDHPTVGRQLCRYAKAGTIVKEGHPKRTLWRLLTKSEAYSAGRLAHAAAIGQPVVAQGNSIRMTWDRPDKA